MTNNAPFKCAHRSPYKCVRSSLAYSRRSTACCIFIIKIHGDTSRALLARRTKVCFYNRVATRSFWKMKSFFRQRIFNWKKMAHWHGRLRNLIHNKKKYFYGIKNEKECLFLFLLNSYRALIWKFCQSKKKNIKLKLTSVLQNFWLKNSMTYQKNWSINLKLMKNQ